MKLACMELYSGHARERRSRCVKAPMARARCLGKRMRCVTGSSSTCGKLSGRRNINLADIGYKAMLLDNSMSRATNEELLIRLFAAQHAGMSNGKGFGPRDPGKERDTTASSDFDRDHPIVTDIAVEGVNHNEMIGTLFRKMKNGLPCVFRYQIGTARTTPVDLTGVPRNAEASLRAACVSCRKGGTVRS
jgi:hypothetical protein